MSKYEKLLSMGNAVLCDVHSMDAILEMIVIEDGKSGAEAILYMEDYLINQPTSNPEIMKFMCKSMLLNSKEIQLELIEHYMKNNNIGSEIFHYIISRSLDRDIGYLIKFLLILRKYKDTFDYVQFFKRHDGRCYTISYDISSPCYYLSTVVTGLGTYAAKYIYAGSISYFDRVDKIDHEYHAEFIIASFILQEFDSNIKAILDNHIKNFMFSSKNSRRFAAKYFETFVRAYKRHIGSEIPFVEFDDYVASIGIKTNKIIRAEMNATI